MNNQKIYDGVKTVNCEFGNNITIGEDSFLLNCKLGNFVQINRRNIIENVFLGDYSYTGANSVLKQAIVGKFCSISWNVSATGNVHNYEKISSHPFSQLKSFGIVESDTILDNKKINIGNDVWIAANVVILPGISIGDGAVIGGGSVVTKSVPPYAVVVGNPAKVIKYRFEDEIIDMLLQSKWWDFPQEIIRINRSLFQQKMSKDLAKELLMISAGFNNE